MPTLEALSALAGEVEVATRTVGASRARDGKVHPSVSTSTIHRRRLPVDVIARGGAGTAMALDARNRVGWVQLTPAHLWSPGAPSPGRWAAPADTGRRHGRAVRAR